MKAVEHRAAARIAWRYARKAKARTALILFLIALPITALTATGILISTAIANPEDRVTKEMGSADLQIVEQPWGLSSPFTSQSQFASSLTKALPVGSTLDTSTGMTAYKVARGTLVTLNVIEHSVSADRAPAAAIFKLFRGRMPQSAEEAALPPATARALGVRVGDTLMLDGMKHPLRIVGLSVLRFALNDNAVLVGPGTLAREPLGGQQPPYFLIDLPRGVRADTLQPAGRNLVPFGGTPTLQLGRVQVNYQDRAMLLQSAHKDQTRLTGVSFAGAVVALFATGMIVVTAFGVGARRQLRAHGLVAATGGEPRHVHAIVLWGGVLLGLVGSAIGVLVAIVAAYVVAPHIDSVANRIIEAIRIPWWVIAGGIVLGTAASTIAALAPARQAAQISAVDALAGRSPHPRAPGRLARRGALGVLIGCGFTVIATLTREWTLLAIALIVTMTGFLFSIPLLVTFVGRWSAHLPALPRLAARQTARYGRRTGAAVAAATLALTAPIALSTLLLSHAANTNRQALLSNDQMVLSSYREGQTEVPAAVSDGARAALPGAVLARIRYASVHVATDPTLAGPDGDAPVYVSGPPPSFQAGSSGAISASGGQLAVADADLLRAAHAEAGIPLMKGNRIIAAGWPTDAGVLHLEFPGGPQASAVGTTPGGSMPAAQPAPGQKTFDVAAVSVSGGTGLGDQVPRYFIPAHLLAKYGFHASTPTQILLRAPHVLTKVEIARVKHAVGLIPGGFAQAQGDYVTDTTRARYALTATAVGLALIIVAVAVALVGAESRRETAILSAVGAAPGVRRRMVGANAFLMTALAGVLAVPAGLVPMALILISERPRQPVPIQWSIVGIVAIGAPLVAGLVAALVSRQPKARAMLQPNW